MRSVVEIHQTFVSEVGLGSEVAYWILSTVCCWSSIGSTVRGTIFGCCRLLLSYQRPGVFIKLIDCWVSSEFSGVNALCWEPSDFVSEVDLSSMLSVLRWGLSDGELAVARTIWRVSVVGGVRSLFDCLQLLLRSIRFLVSEVDFFAGQRFVSGDLPLALISQFVCHNCSVPGFTDGAGFRLGGCVSCFLKHHLVFVTMS